MGLFNINLENLIRDITPPKKRETPLLTFIKGLVSALQRAILRFTDYKEGTSAGTFSTSATKYEQIVFERKLYECVNDTTGDPSTNPNDWVIINDNYLGMDSLQKFNGNTLSLEYALNTFFGTTFSPPPSTSDIYITTNIIATNAFMCGYDDTNSSMVGYTTSTEFITYDYTYTALPASFSINVPTAFFVSLGADAEKIIRSFADNYVVTSKTYDIIQY